MKKNLIFWIISVVFYVVYFKIFDFVLGKIFPISPVSNVIILFILTVINIPLALLSSEKLISIIKKM